MSPLLSRLAEALKAENSDRYPCAHRLSITIRWLLSTFHICAVFHNAKSHCPSFTNHFSDVEVFHQGEATSRCSIINGNDILRILCKLPNPRTSRTIFSRRLPQRLGIAQKPLDLRPLLVLDAAQFFAPVLPENRKPSGPEAIGS